MGLKPVLIGDTIDEEKKDYIIKRLVYGVTYTTFDRYMDLLENVYGVDTESFITDYYYDKSRHKKIHIVAFLDPQDKEKYDYLFTNTKSIYKYLSLMQIEHNLDQLYNGMPSLKFKQLCHVMGLSEKNCVTEVFEVKDAQYMRIKSVSRAYLSRYISEKMKDAIMEGVKEIKERYATDSKLEPQHNVFLNYNFYFNTYSIIEYDGEVQDKTTF